MKARGSRLLAEGFLIMIGILAAFSLDSWWDSRNDRRRELLRLREMRAEFAASRTLLDSLAALHRGRAAELDRFETMLSTGPIDVPTDTVLKLGQALWWFDNYTPTMPAYKELLATTGLQGVTNDSLRRALFEYESVLEGNTDFDTYTRASSITSWEPFMARRMPWLTNVSPNSTLPRLVPNTRQLAADLEFRNLIVIRTYLERGLAERRDALIAAVDRVIKLLNSELGS